MIVQVLQENLLRNVIRTGRIVPAKAQLPIIQNILLTTEDGRLKLTTTNLETTESVLVGAKVEKEGGICISARLLSEFVSSLPQGTVQLTVKEGSILVQCGGYRATIPGTPAAEFPSITQSPKKNEILLDKSQIVQSIRRVVFSAATDEGRPLLTGIKITQKDGMVVFAATDGYRLSVKQEKIKTTEGLSIIVPARAMSEVLKISEEEKDVKEINMSLLEDQQLSFSIGDTELRTRLIDGEYPNYEKIIPTKHNTRVILDREALQRAVKSASIFARDSANIVRFHIEKQVVTVAANTPQIGEDEIEIEAKVEGDGGDMAFNSRFLMDLLANFPDEELVFEMTGSLNPGVFRPVKDDSYLHIIMPVRVAAS